MSRKPAENIDIAGVEQAVWQLAAPLAEQCGARLVRVQFVREAGAWYLRIFLDRDSSPVDLDLCEQVSNLVSPALDAADPIEPAYYLEVSSPGVE